MFSKLKIDISSTIFDIVIFLYVEFFLYGAITRGQPLINSLNPVLAIILAQAVIIIIPSYIGRLWGNIKDEYLWDREAWVFLIEWVLSLGGSALFLIAYIIIALRGKTLEDFGLIVTLCGFTGVAIGGFLAYLYSRGEDAQDEINFKKKFKLWVFAVANLLIVLLPFVVHFPLSDAIEKTLAVLIQIVIIIGILILAGFVAEKYSKKMQAIVEKISDNDDLKKRLEYIFAFVSVTLISLWYEFFIDLLIGTKAGIFMSLYILSVSGYLPLRIMLEIRPPFTPINIITGLISILYFIFTITFR